MRWLAIPAFVAAAACSGGGAADGGGVDASVDLPAATDGPRADRAVDAAPNTPDAGPFAPLGPADVITVSSGPSLDYDAAAFVRDKDGALVVVFSRLQATTFAGKLMRAVSTDGKTFGAPSQLALGSESLVAGPAALRTPGGGQQLYFMAGDATQGTARLYRAALQADGSFSARQQVKLGDPFGGMLAWPTPATLPDGRVALAYDHYATSPHLALGKDGLSFGAGAKLAGVGLQARVAAFSDGSLAFTYQHGTTPFMNYVRLSGDGAKSWSAAKPVTASSSNVHDSFPFARADGGVDLYYIYPAGAKGFTVFRRALGAKGKLGTEQQVTATGLGGTNQPHPHRLPDGRILLTLAREVTNQTDYDVICGVLDRDAPAP
jgi:hypothetical protein